MSHLNQLIQVHILSSSDVPDALMEQHTILCNLSRLFCMSGRANGNRAADANSSTNAFSCEGESTSDPTNTTADSDITTKFASLDLEETQFCLSNPEIVDTIGDTTSPETASTTKTERACDGTATNETKNLTVLKFEGTQFLNAFPAEILELIFAHLSPGFLWIFCRPVCKLWNEVVEGYITRSVFRKGLIQILMKGNRDGDNDDPNYRIYNTVYRCTKYDAHECRFTFSPLRNWKPYSVSARRRISGNEPQFPPEWKVLDVVSSIFPPQFRGVFPLEYYKDQTNKHLWKTGVVAFFNERISREDIIFQSEIDAFHAQPRPATLGTRREISFQTFDFSNTCFVRLRTRSVLTDSFAGGGRDVVSSRALR